MDDRKGILLNLPEKIFEIMKDYKLASGMSYTNIMYNSIVWWLTHKGLLDLSYIRNNNKGGNKKVAVINPNPLPESLKFCSADGCEIDPLIEKIEIKEN